MHVTKIMGAIVIAAVATACGDGISPLAPNTGNNTFTPASEQFSGPIERIVAPDTLVISGQSIRVIGSTTIRQDRLPLVFADLREGQTATVGASRVGSSLTATDVNVADAGGTPTQQRGTVLAISGDRSFFTINVDGATVRGNSDSALLSGSRPRAFGDLRPGDEVAIDGRSRSLYTYAVAVELLGDAPASSPSPTPSPSPAPSPSPSPEPSPSPSPSPAPTPSPSPSPEPKPEPGLVSFSGNITALAGGCPLLVLTVDGRVALTNADTVFSGAVCLDLKVGQLVDVTARANADGTLTVTALRKR